jgi:hypothetical protein
MYVWLYERQVEPETRVPKSLLDSQRGRRVRGVQGQQGEGSRRVKRALACITCISAPAYRTLLLSQSLRSESARRPQGAAAKHLAC